MALARKKLGKPDAFVFRGSAGATSGGRVNKRWLFEDLGADINGHRVRYKPQTDQGLRVTVDGVEQQVGTAGEPRNIRFISADTNQKAGFDFENNQEPTDAAIVRIYT